MVVWSAPLWSMTPGVSSGCCWRVEAIHELDEHFLEAGLVVVGVVPDECDHLAVTVGSLPAVAARVVHHSEAIPAVVHVGEAAEQVACSRLGLVKLGSANQVHYGVGGDIKRVLVSIFLLGPGEAGGDCCRQLGDLQAICGGALVASQRVARRLGFDKLFARDRFLLGKAAFLVLVAAAARAGTFHQLLLACDRDLADTARGAGCKRCNGVVHSAHYWRKPRGRPCRLGREHDRRFSFCCAVDGCRSRATPPSLRFLGPKVYIAAIVVLIATLRHGVTTARLERLSQAVGVDRRTVERWRTWWRDSFTATSFWRTARATFMPPVDQDRLPAALIERFAGDDADRLVAFLHFMGPLTGGRMQAP